MKRIRVLLANRPRLMRELLLATISDQPDIEMVGEATNDAEILRSLEQTHADFLVIALESSQERPPICDFVLERFPRMKILALDPERNLSVYYWASLEIHSNPVESSEEGVLGTLRSSPAVVGGAT